jgi:predicted nucleic acid-binding protein
VIYLDATAVVKLVRQEAQTGDLVGWLNARLRHQLVSSVLVEVEVSRALRRFAPQGLAGVAATLRHLYRVEVDATVRSTAMVFADSELRTLDAIHLATAQLLGTELDAFVSYDKRLLAAARTAGLAVASPGLTL